MPFDQLKRRELIRLLGGAAGWPLAAHGQPHAWPVVGHMHAGTPAANHEAMKAFEQGLGQTGFVDGRNVIVEYRWAQDQYDRLPALAAELVRRGVSVIATGTPVAALAAKRATTSIPIIFAIGSDPVANGLVTSLNRPGGKTRSCVVRSLVRRADPKSAYRQWVVGAPGQAARATVAPERTGICQSNGLSEIGSSKCPLRRSDTF